MRWPWSCVRFNLLYCVHFQDALTFFHLQYDALSCSFPDEFASTRIIGERQFEQAVSLFNSASKKVMGKIDYQHTYVDFSSVKVVLPSTSGEGVKGSNVTTCPAAVGFSFAAGTTDGPGAFSFVQGDDKVGI